MVAQRAKRVVLLACGGRVSVDKGVSVSQIVRVIVRLYQEVVCAIRRWLARRHQGHCRADAVGPRIERSIDVGDARSTLETWINCHSAEPVLGDAVERVGDAMHVAVVGELLLLMLGYQDALSAGLGSHSGHTSWS